MRVSDLRGSPVRKKCSNQVLRSCFQAFTRAAIPLWLFPAVAEGTAPGSPETMSDTCGGTPGTDGRAWDGAPPATLRGVKRTFMNGEIIPIVAPLESANPKMKSAVTRSRKR